MVTTLANRADQHVEAGERFFEEERWADAVAEYTMAIRASAPKTLPSALIGRARALRRSDPNADETFAAFEEARLHWNDDWVFWKECVRFFLAHWESYNNRSPSDQSDKLLKRLRKHRDAAYSDIDAGIERYQRLIETREWTNAPGAAMNMVQLADWMDALELERWIGGGITFYPMRSLAPKLYRVVAESGLESVIPADLANDPEYRRIVIDEVVGRAQRQLVYRGEDRETKAQRSSSASAERGIPILAWVGGGIVWLILLIWVWWLAILVAVGIGGFVLYRKANAD